MLHSVYTWFILQLCVVFWTDWYPWKLRSYLKTLNPGCDPKAAAVLALSGGALLWAVARGDLISKGAGALFVMALWWVTELLPLAVTSLLPMVLYPALGISKSSALAHAFFDGTSFLFCAGFLIGLAVER